MRLVTAIALVAFGGCGNKAENPTAKCAAAAEQGVDALVKRAHDRLATAQLPPDVRTKMEDRTKKLDELVPRLRALLTNRCVDDKWPADVIDCYAKVTSMDELRSCRSKLSPEQQAKVQKEELDLFAGTLGPPGFGSAGPPTSPDIAKLEADLRQLNTQLADATKRVADAANDADRTAAKAALQQVQAQMTAVDEQLGLARQLASSTEISIDLSKLNNELEALDEQVNKAVTAVADAKTDAEREAAKATLQALQQQRQQLMTKLEAARARGRAHQQQYGSAQSTAPPSQP